MFRQYTRPHEDSVPFAPAERKSSLPVLVVNFDTETLPKDGQFQQISEDESDETAFLAFFDNYCISSTNHALSRGYLGGLERMLHHLGWRSNLAKACKVVAFAHHGIMLHKPGLTRKAGILYHELLGNLAKAIESSTHAHTAETMTIALLLGLYEVCLSLGRPTTRSKTNALADSRGWRGSTRQP